MSVPDIPRDIKAAEKLEEVVPILISHANAKLRPIPTAGPAMQHTTA
jgi:hypothetical protein